MLNDLYKCHAGEFEHDSQNVPGKIFSRAHFNLIAERQTSLRAEDYVDIIKEVRSLSIGKELSNDTGQLTAAIHKAAIFNAEQLILGVRVNSLFQHLCSYCYAAQHSYVTLLSLRRDSQP